MALSTGGPSSSQWACAGSMKGLLLSPVSLLLHLWGNGAIFISVTLLRKWEAPGGGKGLETVPSLEMRREEYTSVWAGCIQC